MLVNGDCAYLKGQSGDYQQFLGLIDPIRQAGCPIHLAMGNHDDRKNFWEALPADTDRVKEIEERQVLVVESPRADWVMLDSLDKTNSTPGILGDPQLQWLAKELDQRTKKPVIVLVHHHPATGEKTQGLIDTQKLLDVLLPRRQVKALLYGHTHVWKVEKREDLHCVNLPTTAYVFRPGEPTGWVDAFLSETGMRLELRCLDNTHLKNREKHDLIWRV
jgi:3',5'-cyclic-AMP phosphodiesterase